MTIKFKKNGDWNCPICKEKNKSYSRYCLESSKLFHCDCGYREEIQDEIIKAIGDFIKSQKKMLSKKDMIDEIITSLEYEARDYGEDIVSLSDLLMSKPYAIVKQIYEGVYNGDTGIEELLSI